MLRSRLAASAVMIIALGLVLVVDARFAPYYPLLFLLTMLVGTLATWELLSLLPPEHRPNRAFTTRLVLAVLAANWLTLVTQWLGWRVFTDPWHPVLLVLTGAIVAAFLHEMNRFQAPGGVVGRVAHMLLAVCYLGVLPSFLLRIRWLDGGINPALSTWLLVVSVLVPKSADIGAYTVGRLIGRTPFTPRLSPKKTWEGLVGGLLFAGFTAMALDAVYPVFRGGSYEAFGFGLVVGLAGVFGDLAESMLKRDAGAKDAAARVPGFGGVLDVLDSLLFAAPVAYLWLAR